MLRGFQLLPIRNRPVLLSRPRAIFMAALVATLLAAASLGVLVAMASGSGAAPVCAGPVQEAEAAEFSGNMRRIWSSGASRGAFAGAPFTTRNSYALVESNSATYCVSIPTAGDYRVDVSVYAPDFRNDSIFYSVDGSTPEAWHVPNTTTWETRPINRSGSSQPRIFTLPAGDIEFKIFHRETGTRVDYFSFVDPSTPSPLPTPTSVPPTPTSTPQPAATPTSTPLPVVAAPTSTPTPVPTSTPSPTPIPPTPTSTPTPIPPTPTPTPVAPADCADNGAVAQQAEDGVVSGNVRRMGDSRAEGSTFVGAPTNVPNQPTPSIYHFVEYCVNVNFAGNYTIDGRVLAPSSLSDSFFVSVDGGTPTIWDVSVARGVWRNDLVSSRGVSDPAIFNLSAGEHRIRLYQREAGLRFDSFELRPVTIAQSPTCSGLTQQGEDGALSGSFAVVAANGADEGQAAQASASNFNSTSSIAEFCVAVPASGFYTLETTTLATSAAANRMRVQIDGLTDVAWEAPVAASWTTADVERLPTGPNNPPVEPLTVALTEGNHLVRFVAKEGGLALDSFTFTPTERPTFQGATGFPDPPAPLRSVRIEVGDPVKDLIVDSGPGTEFVFAAGTHTLDTVSGMQPLDGQSFVGEVAPDGTLLSVIDGENTVTRAFRNPDNAKNVTIKHLEIKNFNSGQYDGAVDFDNTKTTTSGDYDTRLWVEPSYWVLEDLWVHHNAGDGVEVGSGARLIDVRSTDNRWLGIGGHGQNIEIIGGELARNAKAADEIGWENWHSGGIKMTRVKDITIRGVHTHHNYGPGIWMDISVNDALIEDNLIANNTAVGIWYEISFNATIRGNTVIQDDTTPAGRFQSGIRVTESWDVRVEDNFVSGIDTAIHVQDQNGNRHRGEIWRQPPSMRDGRPYEDRYVAFVNNTVCASRSGASGFQVFGGSYMPSLDTTLWSGNAYYGTSHERGSLGPLNSAQWQALGYDVDGTVGPYSACPAVPDPR